MRRPQLPGGRWCGSLGGRSRRAGASVLLYFSCRSSGIYSSMFCCRWHVKMLSECISVHELSVLNLTFATCTCKIYFALYWYFSSLFGAMVFAAQATLMVWAAHMGGFRCVCAAWWLVSWLLFVKANWNQKLVHCEYGKEALHAKLQCGLKVMHDVEIECHLELWHRAIS